MRNSRAARGLIAATSRDPIVSQYFEFRMRAEDAAGESILIDTGNTGLIADGQLDIGGTSAGYWANSPWWTPYGDGDGGLIDDQAARDMLMPVNFWGAVGFICDFYLTDNTPSASQMLVDAGVNKTQDDTYMGWDAQVTTSGKLRIRHRYGGSDALNTTCETAQLSAATRYVLGFYIDFTNEQPRAYVLLNGDTSTQQAGDMSSGAGAINMSERKPMSPDMPIGLFQRIDSGGNPIVGLGGTAGDAGVRIGDVRLISKRATEATASEADFFAAWRKACREQYLYPGEPYLLALRQI